MKPEPDYAECAAEARAWLKLILDANENTHRIALILGMMVVSFSHVFVKDGYDKRQTTLALINALFNDFNRIQEKIDEN